MKNNFRKGISILAALLIISQFILCPQVAFASATYAVSYNSQGGSAVPGEPVVTPGATIDQPTDPTRSGYTFGGWYKEPGCTNQWDFLNDPVTADITLYAKWTAVPRTTKITANAGNNSISLSSSSVTAGSSATITAVGDRQSACDITVGNVDGDECYIPEEWSSDDGTTGSFTLSGGSYTASYTPSTAGSHTITVNFGKYYWSVFLGQWQGSEDSDTKTTSLTVNATSTPANAGNNYVSCSPNPIMCGNSVTIEAVGDRQSASGSVVGDERYIPTTWTSSEIGQSGTFTLNSGHYTSDYTPSTAGTYTITATIQKQTWDGTQWVDVSGITDTTTRSLTVDPASTSAVAENNNISLSSSSITVGDSITITAVGDRQSNNGSVEGDERYIPITWTSNETGKSGTFTLNSGNYTSDYSTSTAGNYTITVTFQKQNWQEVDESGTMDWVDVSGIDTKTTSLTVNAAGTTPSAITVEGVNSLNDITVANGTKKSDIRLPETVDATLSDSTTTSASITWDNGSPTYDGDVAGTYTFTGTLTLPDGVTNPNNYKVSVKVIVRANGETTPAAVRIEGTKRVGYTLTAQLKDADGNNYDTSAAVTYEWYRLDNSDSEFINEIGTGKTYKLTKSDLGKYIGVRATCGQYSFKYIIGRISESSSSSSSSSSSKSSSSTEEITVRVTDGSNDKSISKAAIQRITASDGTKKDTVTYTAEKARETIAELLSQGKDVARIVTITEEDAKVSETKINIPNDTLSALSNGNLNLEIETSGVIIAVPKTTVQDLSKNGQLSEDLYFRVVPIKDEAKQQEIKTTANKEMVIKAVSGKDGVQVLGTPMTIETNMTRENVEIVLPLKGVTIPSDPAEREAFLKDLGVFIEHSDGEKVLQKGEIVEYAQGVYGIKFTVNKFSDFTIVKLNQDASVGEGWKNDAQGWKYIKNGQPAIGWNQINSVWYLMDLTGIMQKGWKEVNGVWYYLNDSGAMATGWVQSNGEWYYLYSDGAMASNTVIEGYTLGTSGAWIH